MELFDEEDGTRNRSYETEQKFSISGGDASQIVRHLTEGMASVNYNGELNETMSAEDAAQYWTDARSTEVAGSYEGELPNPVELDKHLDQYLADGQLARIAPAEVTVYFDKTDAEKETGMSYILETTIEHCEETAELRVAAARTLGQPSNPRKVKELANRLDGEPAEAFKTVYDNIA